MSLLDSKDIQYKEILEFDFTWDEYIIEVREFGGRLLIITNQRVYEILPKNEQKEKNNDKRNYSRTQ